MTAKFIWHKSGDFAGHLQGVLKKRKLELVKRIFEGVVARTPVRTGSARASWVVSVGHPVFIYRNYGDHLSPLPPPSFPLLVVPPYAKVYIANGAPYIVELEYGSSNQAPQGMLRVTLASLGI